MIRLTVKGREPAVLAELHRRNLAPLLIIEEKSQFLPEFYICKVSVTDANPENMVKVHAWWADDENRSPGSGFRDGALFVYEVAH